MIEHFKGDEEFVSKVLDMKNRAIDYQMPVQSKFLNPHEQTVLKSIIGKELSIYEYGGFINPENKCLIICPEYYTIDKKDFEIDTYYIKYSNKFDSLKHKDVLGALMHLGITRDCIGDICEEPLSFSCLKETSDYIYLNLNKIKRTPITLVKTDDQIEIQKKYKEKQYIIKSLRLDSIISHLYKLSRNKAKEAILSGAVKVNYKYIEQTDFLCHNNDIVSFKKHGRCEIVISDQKTRKDHYIVIGRFYI